MTGPIEVTIAGRRARYREAGSGRPLILIHAFPLHSGMWEPQLAAAPAGWRLIAPDLPGFGPPSPAADGTPAEPASSIDAHAEAVGALLDHLGIPRAVMAGNSLGGYVTFALLRRRPELAGALVLADTRPQADTEEGRAGRTTMQALVRREGAAALAREMIPRLLGDDTRRERPAIVERVRTLVESNAADALVGALEAMKTRPDSTSLLARIRVPALIVVGEQDRVTPVEVSEEMHRAIAGSRLAIIAGAGHLPSLEQPGRFNAELAGFLQQLT
jgi:3-oxoadipate enol-lactonase